MNPYDAPTTDFAQSEGFPRPRSFTRLAAAIAFSVLAPIALCFLVIHLLVGIENLKRHYWLTDGLVISAILNAIALSPLLNSTIRRFATTYTTTAAIVISLFTFFGYGFWMVALMGV